MNTSQLRYSVVTAVVGFLAASYAAPLDKSGATVIKDASLAKAYAQATRQFTSQGSGFSAATPGQPYATTISNTGQLKLKVGESQVGISAAAYGFGSQRLPISAPTLSSGKDKDGWPEVQLSRTGLSERYVNGTGGMHHWLSVASRPATAQGNLWVNLSVTGAKGFRSLSQTAAEVTIGATKLKYAGLKVWDAAGRTLPARMETNRTGIGLVVTDANAKYPITIDPVWTSETKLVSDNPYSGQGFGTTVAIDGNVAAIGTMDYGIVYVFEKSSSGWALQTTLMGASQDQFGKAIAVHGDMIAVGAPKKIAYTDGVSTPEEDGAVYVYKKQSNGEWADDALVFDQNMWPWSDFGESIALSDDYLVIGAPAFDSHVTICTTASYFSAYRMMFNWDGNSDGPFGASVAVSGNYVAVGDYGLNGGNHGVPRVSVFEVTGDTWNPGFSLVRTFTDPLSGFYNGFGKGLVLTDTDLFVSVPSNNYVAIFNDWKTGSNYSLVDNWDNQNPGFGKSLAYNGQTLFVGDPTVQFSDSNAQGAVYAYVKNSSGNWVQTDLIRPSDNDEYGYYGQSIAATASDLLVGWPYAGYPDSGRTGAAYVYALGSGGTSNPTVTVTFPSLVSYNGTPGIYGSLSGKGLVTLSSAAPNGGTTLDLNSASGHLTVPATVTVAAGETTAEFTFATEYVNSDTDVLVQASGAAVTSGSGIVKVLGNKVLKISGTTINSLGTGTGTVKLAALAQSDFTVYLSSANPNLVQVPESVVVPAGRTSATFTVTTASAVSELTDVYISATPANGEKKAKVTIRPEVQVNRVEIPSNILAGTQAQGIIFLENAPAPAGGQVVTLSSNRSAVTVPATVNIPEGQRSASFDVSATSSANGVATITAKNTNGAKRTATTNVVRPRLASISLANITVQGGVQNTTFTVSLTQAVPFNVTINLSSNRSTLASVPATIIIPAGNLTATGNVTTGRWTGSGSSKAVNISARYQADSSKLVTLTVTK